MSEAADSMDLMKALGLIERLQVDSDGKAAIAFEAGMHMCHSGRVVQGGFIAGWIDSAMAHAAMAMTGPGIVPMSLELKVSYFAPARPGRVVAEAWIERKGRTVCFAEGRGGMDHTLLGFERGGFMGLKVFNQLLDQGAQFCKLGGIRCLGEDVA